MSRPFFAPLFAPPLLAGLATLLAAIALGFGLWASAAPESIAPEQLIRERLSAARPGLPIERITPAEVEGMYRIELTGGEMLHTTADAKFLFGDLWAIEPGKLVNLSDVRRNDVRRELLAKVALKDMVVFAPAKGTRAVVTVFTDVDCGYCQKLHAEMALYNALGIEIRYLAYPRAGIGSPAAAKLVTAWCSKNPQDALTRLKLHETLPSLTCDNPVDKEYALGQAMGVRGTPALVLADGTMLPGYVPAAELAEVLGLTSAPAATGS